MTIALEAVELLIMLVGVALGLGLLFWFLRELLRNPRLR